MPTNPPRAVFVTRETDYELLIARHATRDQARFFLETRGQTIEAVEARHAHFGEMLRTARAAVPPEWRQALVRRADFDRFLFAPEDVIVALGQDGLVANVAKYLAGQPVLGVNPAPDLYDGVLVRIAPDRLGRMLPACLHGDTAIERRTMVEAVLDGGERLLALNEIFVGHRSHQSARYRIAIDGSTEDQSSSGLIVASGTGATGWARSIMQATGQSIALAPEEKAVAFFVREPFPSIATGTAIAAGKLTGAGLAITSRMNEGGTIFADGMEQDHIAFDWGRRLIVAPADRTLNLVVEG
ncbi:NAD(+)/NADH kinase [Flavisphingomonas formosensis]|uniref:NAD(+)/NADH kinase n=1 Tax=Flavisphingomonas formosensis TaxID=861534 RepID=UPI0012F99A2C|nr:NAD(+)/NADH kinase [Sphingomonas formosensis]